MDWAKTTARGYKKHLCFVFGATYTRGFTVVSIAAGDECVWNIIQVVFGEIPFTCITSAANSVLPLNNLEGMTSPTSSKISNIRHQITKLTWVSSCLAVVFFPIHWSQVLSGEWRCSWSSTDRQCSNYIWVMNKFIACGGVSYIRGLTVLQKHFQAYWSDTIALYFL